MNLARASLVPVLVTAIVIALILACLLGSTPLPIGRVLMALMGGGEAADRVVVWSIRLPRALAALVVGMGLGISGAALQALFRNPLAEPGVLGVSATASLAATSAVYFGLTGVSAWLLPFSAIGGALAATALLAAVAFRLRSVTTLILVGVGLSSLASAAISLLMVIAPHPFTLAEMVNWTLGSVANRSFEDLMLCLPFVMVGSGLLLLSRRGLSALGLGDEAALAVGVDTQRLRLLTVLGAGLITGASVALAGAIGFVGIIAPHIVRPWVDHDPGRTLIPSALLAGWVLIVADLLIRVLPTGQELKLGVVAALIGAPFFVLIAIQRGSADG